MSYSKQPGMDGYTGGLTSGECKAMRILAREGWTQETLGMVFETGRVNAHVNGDCTHD